MANMPAKNISKGATPRKPDASAPNGPKADVPTFSNGGVADWDFLDTVTVEEKANKFRVETVPVPPKVLEFATRLRDNQTVATIPIKSDAEFDDMKAVFISAARKLGVSATTRKLTEGEGDNVKAVAIRVTIANTKRGAKSDSADNDTVTNE